MAATGSHVADAVPPRGAETAAVPAHLAFALPSLAAPAVDQPDRLGALKAAVRSWTTARGVKHHVLRIAAGQIGPPVRRALCGGRARWVRYLPIRVRDRLELDGGVVSPLRVEIGSGAFPSPGYVHVDADRRALHAEHRASASSLPFAEATVEELLAIHILEHVHASALMPTLCEWRRVLRPGGFAQIHVPNAATVFAAFLESPPEAKWTLMIPIFGMTSHALLGRPGASDLERHHVIYDFALLKQVLLDAGFDRVDDVSAEVTDRHIEGWRELELIPRISLIVRAWTT